MLAIFRAWQCGQRENGNAIVKTVVIDVANFSAHPKKFIRTGIQEVVYRTFRGILNVRHKFPDLNVILLPFIPKNYGFFLISETVVPFFSNARDLLMEIEKEIGGSSKEIWGIDLKARKYRISEAEGNRIMAEADAVHFQSLVNVGPIVNHLNKKFNRRPLIGLTVYDMVPIIVPECCPDGVPRWFSEDYLPSMIKYGDLAVCISQSTGVDLMRQLPKTNNHLKVAKLLLPFEFPLSAPGVADDEILNKYGLARYNYLLSVGSFEPRKNFLALLDGFETFKRLFPKSDLKLVLVGSTGWNNLLAEDRLRSSPVARDVIRTGYLQDLDLDRMFRLASGVVMLSHYEGFGLPLAQAYSRGVPTLASMSSSLPEACGGQALFVNPFNANEIATGIAALATGKGPWTPDPHLADWTWDRYSENLLDLIQQELATRERQKDNFSTC